MELLPQNKNNLSFFHHLGCVYMGTNNKCGWIKGSEYTVGCIVDKSNCGVCGVISYSGLCIPPKTVEELTGKSPDSIIFIVNFKKNDKSLYDDVKTLLMGYSDAQTEVWCTGNHIVRKKLDIMNQHTKDVEAVNKYNSSTIEKYRNKLIALNAYLEENFGDMGCNLDECDVGNPKLRSIPDEWYHYVEYFDYSRLAITVCALIDSPFHKDLLKYNLV